MKPGHRYRSSSCRFSSTSSDEYAKSALSSSSHSSFLTTSGRTLGVFFAASQFFRATCAKWFSPCRSATVGRAWTMAVAPAAVAEGPSMPSISCVRSGCDYRGSRGAPIAGRASIAVRDGRVADVGRLARIFRSAVICKAERCWARATLVVNLKCAETGAYRTPATHNVFAGRRCQAPGHCAGQGPHWRVSGKRLPPYITRNWCTSLTRCSSSTTTRMPQTPPHAPGRLRARTDKRTRHISRVIRYARPSDWLAGAAVGAISPGLMLYWERVSPSFVGKGGFAPVMRLSGAVGVAGAFLFAYSRSASTCMTLDPA